MKYKIEFLTLIMASIFLFGCPPTEQKSTFVIPSEDSTSNIKKIGNKRLSVHLVTTTLDNYGDLVWAGIINNIFANSKAYSLTRISSVPHQELVVVGAQVVDRHNYEITTSQPITPGKYKLTIWESSVKEFLAEEFTVKAGEGAGGFDDEEGNYIPFTPAKKLFDDGMILSVVDAELGVPSYYVLKLSIPNNIWQAQNATDQYKSNNNLIKSIQIHTNHNISPEVKVGASINPDQVTLTGFDPKDIKTTIGDTASGLTRDTKPIRDFYEDTEITKGIDLNALADNASFKPYHSIEILVFLNDLPKIDQIYTVSLKTNYINTADVTTYTSTDFTFRNAFTKTTANVFLSIKGVGICVVSKTSGRAKCVGNNVGRQTGYDTSNYIAAHPYQLTFLPNLNKVHQIVSNDLGQSACAIMNYDSVKQTSITKCWGSNWKGSLGIGDTRIGQVKKVGDNLNTLIVLPSDDSFSEVAPPFSSSGSYAKSMIAGVGYFCALTFDQSVYCWGADSGLGNSVVSTDSYSPVEITVQYQGQPIKNISNLLAGNSPKSCMLGEINSRKAIYCVERGMKKYNEGYTYKILKVYSGEGHACVLTDESANNIRCYGENKWNQLGNLTSQDTRNSFAPAHMGGEKAIDMVAGSHYTCYINEQFKLKCVGNGKPDITQDTPRNVADGFVGSPRFDFGSKVDVVSLNRSDNILCAVLRINPYDKASPTADDYLYATKCWGGYALIGANYYYKNNNTDPIHPKSKHNRTPILRW